MHFVEQLRSEAEAAISEMKRAAREARDAHARAELMRHMLGTARKSKDKPRDEAIDAIVGEWMKAWHLSANDWPHLAREMRAFTDAFYDYAREETDAADQRLRQNCAALDEALKATGTTISDQMAWRSQCAHGWWEAVKPTPASLPSRRERPDIPKHVAGTAFWETSCAERCKEA